MGRTALRLWYALSRCAWLALIVVFLTGLGVGGPHGPYTQVCGPRILSYQILNLKSSLNDWTFTNIMLDICWKCVV